MSERTKRIIFLSGSAAIIALAAAVIRVHAQPAAPAVPTFPMQVSAQDQQSLRQICALAQKEPSLTLEQSTGIGQYCLGLINRIGLALSPPPAAPAKAPVKPVEKKQ